jgi:hypothetical protein
MVLKRDTGSSIRFGIDSREVSSRSSPGGIGITRAVRASLASVSGKDRGEAGGENFYGAPQRRSEL